MASQNTKVILPKRVVANAKRVTDPGLGTPGSALSDLEVSRLNTEIRDLRAVDPTDAIRQLSRVNGLFSTAVFDYIELASTKVRIKAFNSVTHQFDPIATMGAMTQVAAMSTLYDYTQGYADKPSFKGFLCTLLNEVVQTGACSAELVLNRFRLPEKFVAVPVTTLQWEVASSGDRKFPSQIPTTGGDPIPLDIPTFFYEALHQSAHTNFARPPLEAALQTSFVFVEFIEELWKAIRKAGHTRLTAEIAVEKVVEGAPADIKDDPKKLTQYLEDMRDAVVDLLEALDPADAVVFFDTIDVQLLSAKGEKADYTALLESYSGQMATSLKSMPSTLGVRLQGSQSLSNTESLIHIKRVAGMRTPVEAVVSRALTLGTRLYSGTDSYVKFWFDPIDLRPESELSAHRSVDEQRIYRRLSLGLITDEEAAWELGIFPLPPGAKPLSGTGFLSPNGKESPKDTDNTGGQERVLGEGTESGSPNSSGGGADQ